MNIVHIIGNGFDLNLDLKTSYKDFYDYYIKINSKNEIIYKQPCITSSISLSHFANKIIVGKAYYNSKNKLIKQIVYDRTKIFTSRIKIRTVGGTDTGILHHDVYVLPYRCNGTVAGKFTRQIIVVGF